MRPLSAKARVNESIDPSGIVSCTRSFRSARSGAPSRVKGGASSSAAIGSARASSSCDARARGKWIPHPRLSEDALGARRRLSPGDARVHRRAVRERVAVGEGAVGRRDRRGLGGEARARLEGDRAILADVAARFDRVEPARAREPTHRCDALERDRLPEADVADEPIVDLGLAVDPAEVPDAGEPRRLGRSHARRPFARARARCRARGPAPAPAQARARARGRGRAPAQAQARARAPARARALARGPVRARASRRRSARASAQDQPRHRRALRDAEPHRGEW